jgi:hypothetical protein
MILQAEAGACFRVNHRRGQDPRQPSTSHAGARGMGNFFSRARQPGQVT